MKRIRLSKSVRKYIRLQKARMRREGLDVNEKEKQVLELYQKCSKKHEV